MYEEETEQHGNRNYYHNPREGRNDGGKELSLTSGLIEGLPHPLLTPPLIVLVTFSQFAWRQNLRKGWAIIYLRGVGQFLKIVPAQQKLLKKNRERGASERKKRPSAF